MLKCGREDVYNSPGYSAFVHCQREAKTLMMTDKGNYDVFCDYHADKYKSIYRPVARIKLAPSEPMPVVEEIVKVKSDGKQEVEGQRISAADLRGAFFWGCAVGVWVELMLSVILHK